MDNQEAKFILRAYRPGGADASDPTFSGALEQARRDPELAKWLERERALDAAIAQKLRSLTPPAGLRETLLTGGRVSQATPVWWQRGSWIGLAASIVLALGLAMGWPKLRARAEDERLSALVMDDTLHGKHGSTGEPAGKLEAFLSDPANHLASATMPVDLEKLRTTGCRTLNLAGHDVLEVCFQRAGKEYHLYVMTRIDHLPRSPRIEEGPGAAAATWSDGHHGYVLATTDGAAALRALF